MNGFLNVLKPPGMTSSDVVLYIRRRLPRGTKVGHAGTLDPQAAGVLPIMVGKATRLFDLLTGKKKTYLAQWVPGAATDTQDAFGQVIAHGNPEILQADLEAALSGFRGRTMQTPPRFSALKHKGRRACDMARHGETFEQTPRPVMIYRLRIRERLADGSFLLEIRCGRGTYIRTLCHDIGEALGCHAYMGMLLRTDSGTFTIDDAHTLEELGQTDGIKRELIPMDVPLADIASVVLSDKAESLARCGNRIPVRFASEEPPEGVPLRIYLRDCFYGIGKRSGDEVRFDAMLLE